MIYSPFETAREGLTALLPAGARQLVISELGPAKMKKALILFLTALMLVETFVVLLPALAEAQGVNDSPEVLASYMLSSIDVGVYYNIKVEVRDNDNLSNVDDVWLKLYENSLSQSSPDNAKNHYTFKWVRGVGFSEVGPGVSNEHLNVGACSAGSDSVTTDNWTFRVRLGVTAEPTRWNLWVKVVDGAGHQDNREFVNKFTVNPYIPVPRARRESRPPFLENGWVKEINPVLEPDGSGFDNYAVYNPAVVYENGKFYLFYRAQTHKDGPSSIGMATSDDGIHFQMREKAVIEPTSGGYDSKGCEDPRIVKVDDEYWITYTAYDGSNIRLALATSNDLENWVKRGLVFSDFSWRSKTGTILGEYRSGAVHPMKINGKYYLYYEHMGMGDLYYATSEDLTHWTFESDWIVVKRRPGYFDAGSIEVGPPPMLLEHGILLIYDSCDKWLDEGGKFGVGWAILSREDPTKVIARCEEPFLKPEHSWENEGQYSRVVFAEGLVENGEQWWLYYGAADMRVGLARAPVRERSVLWSVETLVEWEEGTRDNEISIRKAPDGIGLVTMDTKGLWRFDEGAGNTAYDASGLGNNGTIYGASWTEGKSDNALEFLRGDTNDRVEVGDKDNLEGFSEGLTISAWICPYSGPKWGEIVKKDLVYLLRENEKDVNPNSVVFMVWDSGGIKYDLVVSSEYFPTNQWTMITATWDGYNMRIYKDNALLVGQRSARFDRLATSDKGFTIGNQPGGGEGFDGKIDDVIVLSRALTEDEIRYLYENLELPAGARSGEWTSAWYDFGVTVRPENLEILASVGASENARVAVEVSKDGSSVEDNLGWLPLESDNTIDLSTLPDCQYARVKFRLETENMRHSPSIRSFTLDGRGLRLMVSTDSASFAGDNTVALKGTLIDLENEETRAWFQWRENGAASWNETGKQPISWRASFSDNISGLTENVTYEFRAVAQDNTSGENTTGRTLSFVMDTTPPSAFRLLSPDNNAVIPYALPLSWEASSDSESGLSHYEVWLKEDSWSNWLNVENVVENRYTTSDLPRGTYRWYVVAVNRLAITRRSENEFTFTIEAPPNRFKLLSPNGSCTLENRVILKWENSSGVAYPLDKYEIWINDVKVSSVLAGTTYYMTPELPRGPYEWYIVAVDNVGNWRKSENVFTFYIGPPPPYAERKYLDGFEDNNLDEYIASGMEITDNALSGSYSARWTGPGTGYAYVFDLSLGKREGKVSTIFTIDNSNSKAGVGFASKDGTWVYAVVDPAMGMLRVERKGSYSIYDTTPSEWWKNQNSQPMFNWGAERQEGNFFILDVERYGTGTINLGQQYRLTLMFSKRSMCAMAVLQELGGFVMGRVRAVVDVIPEHPLFLSDGPAKFDNFYFDLLDNWLYNWDPYPLPVLSPTPSTWDQKGAFNPSVGYWDNMFHMFYRGNEIEAPGETDQSPASSIGYATSPDGYNWTKHPAPVLVKGVHGGISLEDPTVLINPFGDNVHYLEYTNVKNGGYESRMRATTDFVNFGDSWLIHPSRKTTAIVDTAASPWGRPVYYSGQYYRFFTYMEDGVFDTMGFSNNLENWVWRSLPDNEKVGGSNETWSDLSEPLAGAWIMPDGNILVTTCMSTFEGYVAGPEATIGAMIFKGSEPWVLLKRATIPFIPDYYGHVWTGFAGLNKDNRSWYDGPNFPGGFTMGSDNWLYLYYGGNDQYTGVARTRIAPEFQYRGLMLDKVWVYQGESVTASVVVRNVGNLPGDENVKLYAGGELENSMKVTLERDEENTVELTFAENEPGIYVVQVGQMTSTLMVIGITNPPTMPYLLSPPNDAKISDNTPSFEWTYGLNADSHRILVDNDGDLLSPIDNVLLGATDSIWTKSGPGYNDGVHYWKVVAINAYGENSSEVWTFEVDTVPPGKPTLVSPENNKVDNTLPHTFTWTQPENNLTYYIQIDNEAGFDNTYYVHENTAVDDNSYTFTLPGNATYYWRVRARDEAGNWGAWSDNFKLTITGAPAGKPVLQQPANGSYTNDNTPTLTWTAGPNADSHRLLVDNDPDFSSPNENRIIPMPTDNYTIAGNNALPNDNYYWKVIAISGSYENSSDVWTFMVDTNPPSAFDLLTPGNGATVTTNRPTLTWENSSDNEAGLWHYEVWLDGKNVDNLPLDRTSYTTSMLSEGSHQWYVVAVDNAVNRTRSGNIFTFTVRVISVISYVDPFIGTMYGHTNPGPAVPFAMTTWDPARKAQASGIDYLYEYDMTEIAGFRSSHFPSGSCMSDYACITIMPESGDLILGPNRASSFSHQNEIATPGYYAVTLDKYGIRPELTSTVRSGIMKFTFSQAGTAHILVDTHLGTGHVEILPGNNEIVGYSDVGMYRGPTGNFKGYFVVKFNKSFSSYGTWEQGTTQHLGSTDITAYNSGGWVTFSVNAGETITVKASISFISVNQARANLNNEIPDWDFNKVKGNAENAWENALSKIEVVGGTEDQKKIFYTALYHSLLVPRVSSEYGKYWSCFDGQEHTISGREFYNDFSMWDIFRSEYAILTLLYPDRVKDMCQSLVDMYEQGGWMPKWPNPGYSSIMIGTHGDSLITEAYLKGITSFDVQKAYEGMVKNATQTPPAFYEARTGINDYMSLGYCPTDKGYPESTSLTLEYAYDDWAIAQLAKALGRESDYNYYLNRATYYRNVFDNSVGFVRGRKSDGSWAETTFDSRSFYSWMCQPNEGDPWQYTWFAPHDVWGLKQLVDGSKSNPNYPGDFNQKLETLLQNSEEPGLIAENKYAEHGTVRYYWHGNEPGMHIPYLFDYSGKPWRTQYWVDNIMKTRYRTYSYGLPGNDDGGQISSWYVFSAMGFYPVTPPSLTYAIGRPIFDKVTIHLPNDKDFVIEAQNVSDSNMYIQSATLNVRPLTKPWFEHSKLIGGGKLTFAMGPSPNTNWGTHPSHAPPSMSGPKFLVENLKIYPPSVGQGENENVTISVDVANVGTAAGPKLVELEVDGSIVDSKEVTLNTRESRTVSFALSENELGVHTIYIEDLQGFFTVAPPGKFLVENLRIDPPKVYVGENVTISVDVVNIGENAGIKFLVLLIDNEVEAIENVALDPGESRTVSFKVSRDEPGEYEVRIENLVGIFGVETKGGSPEFLVENLKINPRRADPGENVTISVDMANIGGASGSKLLSLKVDGSEKDSENVALGPRRSVRVSFTVAIDNLGFHTIEVDGLRGYLWVIKSSEAENTKRVEVGDILAGENKKIDVEGVSITGFVITARNSVGGEEIEVLEFKKEPSGVPPAPPIVYRYLSITPSVSRDEDIENVVIGFKVELSWISQNGVDVGTIKLYRYDPENEEWNELPTKKVEEDEKYAYFEATSPKFSMYAISAKSQAGFPLLVPVIGSGILAAAIGYFMLNRRGAFALKRRKTRAVQIDYL